MGGYLSAHILYKGGGKDVINVIISVSPEEDVKILVEVIEGTFVHDNDRESRGRCNRANPLNSFTVSHVLLQPNDKISGERSESASLIC